MHEWFVCNHEGASRRPPIGSLKNIFFAPFFKGGPLCSVPCGTIEQSLLIFVGERTLM